ncbi:MAG: hypothetical protein V1845_01230 [bacterium]
MSSIAFAGLKSSCTTLKDGLITYSVGHYLAGQPITPGYDVFGYNYQAHSFIGSYANAYVGKDGLPPYNGDDASYLTQNPTAATKWYWPYRHDRVMMKWNDAWLSNMDCDGDGLLDRSSPYIGSGAWLTNHNSGEYTEAGIECSWFDFVKIVAAPADAYEGPPTDAYYGEQTWYAADGTEIGPQIWEAFAVIQEVYNDPCAGKKGLSIKSALSPGFGIYAP